MRIRNSNRTIKAALELAKKHAQAEYAALQFSGRALSPEEKRRCAALRKCLRYIEEGLRTIEVNMKYKKELCAG